MEFMIPLKFSDRDIVRNTEQLKEKFSTNYKDILTFIESGELERFFSRLDKNDLKSLMESMKKEGMKGSEIAKKLADTLGVEVNADDEHGHEDEIVRHDDELKSILEGNRTALHFPSGKWIEKNQVIIKSAKNITGSGNDRTAFFIGMITIDIPDGDVVEIESVTFKKIEGQELEGVIIIKNGNVTFKNTVFEDIRLIAKNKSNIKIINGLFAFTPASIKGWDIIPKAITIEDEAEVDIGEETRFEKIENPIVIEFDDYPFEIKKVKQYGKYSKYRFSKKYIDLWFKERLIELSDYLYSVRCVKLAGKIELSKPIAVVGGEFFVEGDGELIIEAKSGSAFYIALGGSLQLKNVRVLSATDVGIARLIEIDDGKLEMDGCEVRGSGSNCIFANKSEIVINNTSILDAGRSGVYLKSSKASITKSKITNNKGYGVQAVESSTIEINNCEIRQNGKEGQNYPQMWIENSELFMEDTIVADSVGGNGIFFRDSKGEISNCEVFNNARQGVWIEKSSVKIKSCEVKDNLIQAQGILEDQICIKDKSDVIMEGTIISVDRNHNIQRGIGCDDSTAAIDKCKIHCYGDAIYANNASISIKRSEILGVSHSSGIYVSGHAATFIEDTIVDSCMAGIKFWGNNLEMLRCTITNCENEGIYVSSRTSVKIIECKVAQNKGPELIFKSGTQIEVGENCDVLIQKSEIKGGKKGYSIKSKSPIKAENSFIEGGIRYE